MDIEAITQLIGGLGFPIVACGAMFWKIHEQDKRHSEDNKRLGDIIANNTNAINNLLSHFQKGE